MLCALVSIVSYILGGLLNVAAISANNGMMPVYVGKLTNQEIFLDNEHVSMATYSHLKILCDYISIGDTIASPGDVLLVLGFLGLIVSFLVATYLIGKAVKNKLNLVN